MAITTQKTIRQLVDTMSNSDKDYRFMATSDLIVELQQGCRLDEESEQKIAKALVTLLNDINDEVQTQAVKCLVLLSCRLSDSNLLNVFHSLIASIGHSDKASHRMICAIALKNVISSLPSTSVALINLVTREPLVPMIEIVENQQDDDVLQEVIEILAEMLSRFGVQMQVHHERILCSLQQVLYNPRQTLRKRAIIALGHLMVCLPTTQYELFLRQVVQGKLPVGKVVGPGKAERKFVRQGSDEEIITRLQCLSVLSQHPSRFSNHISGLLPVVLTYKEHESDEVREAMLQVLEAFIFRCPMAMVNYVASLLPFFCQMLAHDPNYAVCDDDDAMDTGNNDMDDGEDANGGFGMDDEEFTDEDDDDDSWKVRRSAAKCLQAAFSTYGRDHLLLFHSQVAPHLIRRFKEREETVLCEIFAAFRELLTQTRNLLERHWGPWISATHHYHHQYQIGPSHYTSSLPLTPVGTASNAFTTFGQLSDSAYHYRHLATEDIELHPEDNKILSEFQSLCKDTVPRLCHLVGLRGNQDPSRSNVRGDSIQISSRQMRIYRETLNVLSDLVLTLPPPCTKGSDAVLANHIPLLLRLVKMIVSGSEFDSNLRLEAVSFLTLLVIRHESPVLWQNLIADLVGIILGTINDSFLRISSESLSLLQCLSPRLEGLNAQHYAKQMFAPAFKEMLATDRDMELKEQVICAETSLIVYNAPHLSAEISIFLQALSERLDNEVTRSQVMRSIIELAESPLNIPLDPIFPHVLTKVPQLFRQNDRSLRLIAFKCMEAMWRTRGAKINPPELGMEALKELCTSLQEYDSQIIQVALLLASHIMESSVSNNEDARNMLRQRLLPTMIDYLHNGMLHGPTLDAFVHLLGVISKMQPPLLPCETLMEALKRPLKSNKLSLNQIDAVYGVACCIAQLIRHQSEANIFSFLEQSMDYLKNATESYQAAVGNTITLQIHILTLAEMGKYLSSEIQSQLLHALFHVLRSADSYHVSPPSSGIASTNTSAQTSCIEELKKSTASALGRMAVCCLDAFVPFLAKEVERANPEHRYFLLHALKETLTYLCNRELSSTRSNIAESAIQFWDLLMLYCNAPADGIRNTIGECMGKAILLNPLQLMPKLVEMIAQTQNGTQCNVLFCAAKFTVWSQLPRCLSAEEVRACARCLDDNLLTLLEAAVYTLRQCATSVDPVDLACQRSILVYVNTLLHLRGSLVRHHWLAVASQNKSAPILQLPNFVYQLTIRRQELVHMVEMGPFKHQQDAGLEIRKCAYECMNSLLENCLDIIHMPAFCEALERGLEDQNELKHSVYLMLIRLCSLRPSDIVLRLERFLLPIRQLLQEKAKRDLVKQEQDKLTELKRSALRVVAAMSFISDIEKNAVFADFIKNNLPPQSEARITFDAERRDMQLQHQQMLSLGHHRTSRG